MDKTRDMMPSMRNSFLKQKKSADLETNPLSRSQSNIILPNTLGGS